MAELLTQYFRIAFLMGRPQDLPFGGTQLRIGLALAVATYLLALIGLQDTGRVVGHVVLDLGCTALAMYVALVVVGHPGRFEQAFGGLCGASAFVNLAAVPIYRSEQPFVFAQLLLLVWSLSLLAHVLRHTFDIRLWVSVAVAAAYFMTLLTLLEVLMPFPEAPVVLEDS